jgi:hypothetical protein
MKPEKAVLKLLLPTVRVFKPRNTKPSPAKEPIFTPAVLRLLPISNSPLPRSEILAVPPFAWSSKTIAPPSLPSTPPLAVIVALAAVLLSVKTKAVPARPDPMPPLIIKVPLAAVAPLKKEMSLPTSPMVLAPTAVK